MRDADRTLDSPDNADTFTQSWLWSIAQRWLAMEPILIALPVLLPLLCATRFCTNLCSEGMNQAVGVTFAVIVIVAKRLRTV